MFHERMSVALWKLSCVVAVFFFGGGSFARSSVPGLSLYCSNFKPSEIPYPERFQLHSGIVFLWFCFATTTAQTDSKHM